MQRVVHIICKKHSCSHWPVNQQGFLAGGHPGAIFSHRAIFSMRHMVSFWHMHQNTNARRWLFISISMDTLSVATPAHPRTFSSFLGSRTRLAEFHRRSPKKPQTPRKENHFKEREEPYTTRKKKERHLLYQESQRGV